MNYSMHSHWIGTLLILLCVNHLQGAALISSALQPLLGNVDLDEPYKTEVKEALCNFKVPNVESVSIKKMDKFIPSLIDKAIISYTIFGLWFDQDYLARISESQRTWNIYHEAAHYAARHSTKAMVLIGMLGGLSYITVPQFNNRISTNYTLINGALYLTTWSTALAASFYTLQELIRDQEKEADLNAARLLLLLNREDIVVEQIDELRNQIAQGAGDQTDYWHYSPYEQAEYLITCIQAHS